MSNTPGINPLTPDLEEIRHSERPAPEDRPAVPEEDEETEEEAAARIGRETIDLA